LNEKEVLDLLFLWDLQTAILYSQTLLPKSNTIHPRLQAAQMPHRIDAPIKYNNSNEGEWE